MAMMRPPLEMYKKSVFGEDAADDDSSQLMDFISSALQSKSEPAAQESQPTQDAVSPNVAAGQTETLNLGNINNLLTLYGDSLTKQKGLDDSRYKAIEDTVNKQRSFDLTPEQYEDATRRAHGARAIAGIFQAANLGGNGGAFQNIGQNAYESALSPITESRYFQDQLRGRAKDQMELGSLQRQNLKEFGGDIENLLQSAKPYEALKIDRDKNDPKSNISIARAMQFVEKMNRLKSQLANESGSSYQEFGSKIIPDFQRRLGFDDTGKFTPGSANYNQIDALDKEFDAAYNTAKGLEGQKIQRQFASAAGVRAASSADPKAPEIKMIDDINKMQASIEGLNELANIKLNVKTGKLEGGAQWLREKLGLPGDPGMDDLKAAVARIFNKETHEISGAAVSKEEWDRIAPQIPDASDPDERFMSKLNGALREVRKLLSSRVSTYEAYKRGGYSPADLDKIKSQTKSTALSPQDQKALDWANANPNDARSAEIKKRLGVK